MIEKPSLERTLHLIAADALCLVQSVGVSTPSCRVLPLPPWLFFFFFFIAAHANTLPLLFFPNYRLVAARTADLIWIGNFRVPQALKMQVA